MSLLTAPHMKGSVTIYLKSRCKREKETLWQVVQMPICGFVTLSLLYRRLPEFLRWRKRRDLLNEKKGKHGCVADAIVGKQIIHNQ